MPATRSSHDCQAIADAVSRAGGRVPDTLANILHGAALLNAPSAAPAPAKAILDAAVAGQLTEKSLTGLIEKAAHAQMVATYRGEQRRDSEHMFVAEFHRALKDGAADEVLDSLRPQFDAAAEQIAVARSLFNAESSAEHVLAGGEPAVVTAWQGLNAHLAVVTRIAAIASAFGCRTAQFPMLTEYSLGDNFQLEDRALMATDGPLPIDSGLFRIPDQGHRTSPFFQLPLKLHSVASAQARYNDFAADEFDRVHDRPQEQYQGEDGLFHERPRPRNPYRQEANA